ncbi:MAG: stage II sporulation protein P, partial [Oscillospiraceae bacterium]|nr:stage II sporulation protein P [Oscillospiraceae bacterium]
MRRISIRSRKRRKAAVITALFLIPVILCFVLKISSGTDSPEKDERNPAVLDNIVSEAYAGLRLNEWNPLEQEPSETAEELPEEKNSTDSDDPEAKPYPQEWILDPGTSVLRTTLTGYSGKKIIKLENGSMVLNNTSVENSLLLSESTLTPAFRISVNEKPQVLIMHTHTTESYEPYVRENFDKNFNYRTTDETMNVTAVGNAIAEKLQSAGIAYIHDTTIHDYPSYTGGYERSAE